MRRSTGRPISQAKKAAARPARMTATATPSTVPAGPMALEKLSGKE